jgi:thiol-disulfide isomerase/thioredoxin
MKLLLRLVPCLLALSALAAPEWLTDLDAAKAKGVKEGKPVLVDFTGSDWCPPCKALHKNVFMSAEFAAEASKYVLVELDYPRTTPQPPELKAKNRELQQQFGITGFPTVLLIDAKSGDVFGKTVGFGGDSAKAYLSKLAAFKNTPEGRASLNDELKKNATRSAKNRELNAKITAAITAKDFKAADAALEEIFADAPSDRRALLFFNKARLQLQVDPAAKAQALKFLDEAQKLAEGDEVMTKNINGLRSKIAPANAAPKAPADPKKGA